ncbi:MAG TPA: LysM peptidoglycan-binding domain-containing protein [Feifaniaceae bacterium]|nr:LysM peptidoglycan-binding domain-containing protein [Feifaniaceae bacterium]
MERMLPKEEVMGLFDYIVQPGDTVYSISRLFDITTAALLAANPQITDIGNLAVGQTLRIPGMQAARPMIEVNGYAYPNVSESVLEDILPYLTYLSIIGFETNPDGSIIYADDGALVGAALLFHVAPLMVVSNRDTLGNYLGELAHMLLSSDALQQVLIGNIIAHLQETNYYGVNVDFSEIYAEDYAPYAGFLQLLTSQLHPLGYIVVVAPRINIMLEQAELLERINRQYFFNGLMDRLILRTTVWTCTYDESLGLSRIDELQRAVDSAARMVSSNKILLTVPNCCYDWRITNAEAVLDRSLSPAQADELLMASRAKVHIDPKTQASYFLYYAQDGTLHQVWCENETNLRGPLALVSTYRLGGISFRTIDRFSMVSYRTLGSLYEVRKVV